VDVDGLFWANIHSVMHFNLCSQTRFKEKMLELKDLSAEAYDYMASIPPSAWSRHAFDADCKSNMLLNNMCESFNAVLKPCRDKAVLTQMEWIRRYIMQRHYKKREGLNTIEGILPYVKKQFQLSAEVYKTCIVRVASTTLFEVDFKEQTCLVDLNERSCSCFRWQLTGIPCHHAYATIMNSRGNCEEFIHEYYSKAHYAKTYAPVVMPMPGASDWEKTPHNQPDPPPYKKLPGRPSKKKRRLEPDEGKKQKGNASTEQAGREIGKQNRCSFCKQPGHNKRKCTSTQPAPTEPRKKGGRPPLNDDWSVKLRERRDKQKEAEEAVLASQASTLTQASQSSTILETNEYPDSPTPVCV
jgi:SWIM zinc finger